MFFPPGYFQPFALFLQDVGWTCGSLSFVIYTATLPSSGCLLIPASFHIGHPRRCLLATPSPAQVQRHPVLVPSFQRLDEEEQNLIVECLKAEAERSREPTADHVPVQAAKRGSTSMDVFFFYGIGVTLTGSIRKSVCTFVLLLIAFLSLFLFLIVPCHHVPRQIFTRSLLSI